MPSETSLNCPSTPLSTSGIQTLPTGHSIIPSSVRSDGSKREEKRVRFGYRPPEDQKIYRNPNVEARSNIGKGGIPGAEPATTPGAEADKRNRNAKRREAARRKAAAAADNEVPKPSVSNVVNTLEKGKLQLSETEKLKQEWRDPNKLAASTAATTEAGGLTENEKTENEETKHEKTEDEKKIRKLQKQLRKARELEDQKRGGGKLLPQELAKVMKIHELIRDLNKLGFDAVGESGARDDEAQRHQCGNDQT